MPNTPFGRQFGFRLLRNRKNRRQRIGIVCRFSVVLAVGRDWFGEGVRYVTGLAPGAGVEARYRESR